MKRIVFISLILLFTITTLWSADNQSADITLKIEALEERISVLEEFVLPLIEQKEQTGTHSVEKVIDIESDIIGIRLLELSYHESNASNNYANDYSDWISLSFKIDNNTERSTKAIKGAVVFADVFGEEWMRIGLTLNNPIAAGESIVWEGKIDYNGFKDQHKQLRYTSIDEVVLSYDVSQIIYADGERVSYE